MPKWINGQPGDRLPVSDRGLAYGDGVFETLRVVQGRPVLFDYHLERLQLGLQRLQIKHDWAALENEIMAYPGCQQDGVVKLLVTRGQGGRGYGTQNIQGPTRVFSWHELPVYPDSHYTHGISVYSCRQSLSANTSLAGLKHLNRLEQVMARQEWGGDYQEGLMLDGQGNVIEGVFSNLFVVQKGTLLTPDLKQSGVAGTMRRWLLECFAGSGYQVDVGQVTLQDIRLADEWFFCNSVYGIWPVRQWEDRTWIVGNITRQAQQWIKDRWQF
ncbi:MAG: aminodeoxychorismate lyase [Ketobacter sp.]|nr:MAG: aminodeoxychorismate lyase [Ketobacter sp.]